MFTNANKVFLLGFSAVFVPKIRFKLPECFPKFATLFPNVY